MAIKEDDLISRNLESCENCEWCIPNLNDEFPHCLLKGQACGLFEKCSKFKERTGMHISI